jgi:DNA-directed RNA polymerase subunit H (RpoH/RPB5)
MNNNFVVIDAIYRSRMTLLDILGDRGYDVEKYRKFSPDEATAAIAANAYAGLSFKVEHPDKVCDVRYVSSISRQKLDSFFDYISDEDAPNTEVIVMLQDPISDAHHVCALKQYVKFMENIEDGQRQRRKLRVSFFSIYTLVINPLKHVLVPKHEIVPEEEHKQLMDSMYIVSKAKFPQIKFHVDPITRCIGAVPGDILKITRPSASSGVAIIYRVCIA